ncbi:AAA family ATPase [Sedimenticola selenatireducens]|uniref:AAA family ATPase n=1 Tax=Sedimenticola selenatireducens TaxID=191960 RepID=UPI00048B29E7|nr:DUF3696 domain-containing protein [Sedimenticola selenatireducens]
MRVTSLSLANFKAIGSATQVIEFKPITLLFGPNSAGKSSLIQALHYLYEIFERDNCDPGHTQIGGDLDLGGFRNLVHGHDLDATIRLGIGIELGNSLLPTYGSTEYIAEEEEHTALGESLSTDQVFDLAGVKSADVTIDIKWSELEKKAFVSHYSVQIDDEPFAFLHCYDDSRQASLKALNSEHTMFDVPAEEGESDDTVGARLLDHFNELSKRLPLQIDSGRGAMPRFGELLGLMPAGAFEPENAESFSRFVHYISRVMVGTGELVLKCLRQFLYLGPLREIPGRHFMPERSPGLDRWSSGLGAWDQLYNEGEDLADKVNDWLANDERLDAGYAVNYTEYKPLALDSPLMVALQGGSELLESPDWIKEQLGSVDTRRQVTLHDLRSDIDLYPEDLGTGISQVLPVLVAALGHNKNIVAVEQPELHVHPKFQVALGELFLHAIKGDGREAETVFILETHSEYMMLRFLRRLYETANDELDPDAHALTPDELAVYYVNPIEDKTEITHLRLTEEGEFLDRWPNGFFPERKKELF